MCVLYCIPTAVGQDFEIIVFSNSFSPSLPPPSLPSPSLSPLSILLLKVLGIVVATWLTSQKHPVCEAYYPNVYVQYTLSIYCISLSYFPFLSFSLYIITPKSLHSIILCTHTHAHILSLSLPL